MKAVYSFCKKSSENGRTLGDFWALGQNWKITKNRNKASTATVDISLRAIANFCSAQNFDVRKFLTPLVSTVQIFDKSGAAIFEGALTHTPGFTLNAIDNTITLEYADAIWMMGNDIILPTKNYNDNLDTILRVELNAALARSANPVNIAPWFFSLGSHWDSLAQVQDTVDSVKKLQDFVIERTNNVTGAGQFDVYVTGDSVVEIWKNLGTDVSKSTTLSFPDYGQTGGAQEMGFPEWENYWSDIYLTGSGNGYGDGGGAVTSSAWNLSANANTGYSRFSAQDSSIGTQSVLDAKVRAYLAYTGADFSTPTVTLDAEKFKMRDHRDGGNLWVGDTVGVSVAPKFANILPVQEYAKLRVDSIKLDYDMQARAVAKITFTDPSLIGEAAG